MSRALVINSGSSSLKFAVFEVSGSASLTSLEPCYRGQFSGLGGTPRWVVKDAAGSTLIDEILSLASRDTDAGQDAALRRLLTWVEEQPGLGDVEVIGHRIVHGGQRYRDPVRLDADSLAELDTLIPLAPLHQPYCLAAVRALARLRPEIAQVGCFDTAFHAHQPWTARTFALPRRFAEEGVLRYGFHGLSYDYISRVLPARVGRDATGRVIVAHLGNGASLCAIRDGESLASSMGFTALDGLMMGTRSGSLDPGVVLHLLQQGGMSLDAVQRLLYQQSGLLGVSGISGDMRELLASDKPEARQAIELFVYRVVREIGSLVAVLGGLDHLVFTAGIGERAAPVRRAVADGCAWLGIALDEAANRADATSIAAPGERPGTWVIPTDEERMVAWYAMRLSGAVEE